MKSFALALSLAGLVILLYAPRLRDAPIYLAHDEIGFALQAHSIASTGRDLNGRILPLYFSEPGYTSGRDPISIYFTALLLTRLPLSETTVRLPSLLVGALDVVLMFFVARLIFKRLILAVVAASLLVLTPAHFVFSRLGLSVIYPLPFILAWLLCLLWFLERRSEGVLFAGTACLGIGVYSYLASVVTMPVCLVLTCIAIRRERPGIRLYLVAAAGFFIPLLPLLVWHLRHPERYGELVQQYQLYDSAHVGLLRGLRSLVGYFGLGVRSDVYWRFFSPGFLFFSGDSSIVDSTREAGVFTWPVAILLPLGIYQIIAGGRRPIGPLLLGGFALAPLASVITADVAIHRSLALLPFGVLIAAYGAEALLFPVERWRRLAGVLLLALVAVHFRHFYADYFDGYRVRSAGWFGGNIRGAMEEIIRAGEQDSTARIYLSSAIPFIDSRWRFYLIKHGQQGLLSRTVYYDPEHVGGELVPDRVVALSAADPARTEGLLISNRWRTVRRIVEPNGSVSFLICER